ncbi:hypothetical protein GGTG_13745 [Gaeumannomyces tritici R3-111a-1]|uniref:Uncharacterized protein n=1 Tax=Gaeumannomyces tritici (strain R3-111a-1) TaxID=644352 RepID=J3PJQ7_GAET3|nr:hypothetical protein GGTG_13745 [Gaeumannomyces tritici R3-111a-1]EJT68682.1 hypothetical protein GGTG_13745 [Gaeumannomyces tritici R3-111a-1]
MTPQSHYRSLEALKSDLKRDAATITDIYGFKVAIYIENGGHITSFISDKHPITSDKKEIAWSQFLKPAKDGEYDETEAKTSPRRLSHTLSLQEIQSAAALATGPSVESWLGSSLSSPAVSLSSYCPSNSGYEITLDKRLTTRSPQSPYHTGTGTPVSGYCSPKSNAVSTPVLHAAEPFHISPPLVSTPAQEVAPSEVRDKVRVRDKVVNYVIDFINHHKWCRAITYVKKSPTSGSLVPVTKNRLDRQTRCLLGPCMGPVQRAGLEALPDKGDKGGHARTGYLAVRMAAKDLTGLFRKRRIVGIVRDPADHRPRDSTPGDKAFAAQRLRRGNCRP